MSSETDHLLFATTNLHVDATFWHEVEQRKLNFWKLAAPTVDLACSIRSPLFTAAGYRDEGVSLVHNISVDNHSFRGCHNEANTNSGPKVNHSFTLAPSGSVVSACAVRDCSMRVDFYNCNLVEEFSRVQAKEHPTLRQRQLHFCMKDLVQLVKDDKIGTVPLTRGYIFSFADLKQHTFRFNPAIPVADLPASHASKVTITSRKSIDAFASEKNFTNDREGWFDKIMDFVVKNCCETHSSWNGGDASAAPEIRLRIVPFLVPISEKSIKHENGNPKILTNDTLLYDVLHNSSDYAIAMLDAGNSNAQYPAWVWRNVMTAVRIACPALSKFTLIALRGGNCAVSTNPSMVFECRCEPITCTEGELLRDMSVSGWKKEQLVDLSSQMDPVKLADSSANLNLQLMKWRMLPELNLERLGNLKCLLLGSGTLGCNIARHLVMWGVRHITMLDRGNVSHSNPVRQTLFEHADVLKEGEERVKSVAAANALKRILPTVNAKGVNLTIRMPGHRIDDCDRDAARKDVEALTELIKSHDVCYLLTDSRESRWLPTLLSIAHNVPVINAALAFDTYVVMRHGLFDQGAQQVGCYFCNDVVAPIDSLSARSLDQQCTVTRPGVSAMASAMAVELLASLLNHPRRFLCPAWVDEDSPAFDKEVDSPESECKTCLSIVPHQLRGDINQSFACNVLHGRAYSKCTACSKAVVGAYKAGGVEWLLDVINDPSLLEKTSGLEAERKELDDLGADGDCDFDDE